MVNQQILNYLRQNAAGGYPISRLRAQLLYQGYPPQEVDAAIAALNQPQAPAPGASARAVKRDFPIHGWKWFFYVLGWINALSIPFWLVAIIIRIIGKEKKFFGRKFHDMVFWFGFLTLIGFFMGLFYGMFFGPPEGLGVVAQNLTSPR